MAEQSNIDEPIIVEINNSLPLQEICDQILNHASDNPKPNFLQYYMLLDELSDKKKAKKILPGAMKQLRKIMEKKYKLPQFKYFTMIRMLDNLKDEPIEIKCFEGDTFVEATKKFKKEKEK